MKLLSRFRQRWGCFKFGHRWLWMRNIYGDEINARNGMRSEWRCYSCRKWELRPELAYLDMEDRAADLRLAYDMKAADLKERYGPQ